MQKAKVKTKQVDLVYGTNKVKWSNLKNMKFVVKLLIDCCILTLKVIKSLKYQIPKFQDSFFSEFD